MPTFAPPPSYSAIAESYGMSRQMLWKLRRKYSVDYDHWLDPDRVLEVLLEKAPASPLRSRLTDPSFRQSITLRLS
jgi:hypothetical protein